MKSNLLRKKKGISVVIGYILLVSFVIVMGFIVYKWMQSYIPKDAMECPEEVSLFLKEVTLDCSTRNLTIEFQNNGRFNIDGYFIHASDNLDQKLATIDLSENFFNSSSGLAQKFGSAITFDLRDQNTFKSGDSDTHTFILDNNVASIEIVPERYQIVGNRERVVQCSTSRVKEVISPQCS